MKPNSLRIFKKKNGINLTPDQLGALVLTILLLLLVFLEKPLGYSFDGWVTFVSILWFLYLIVLLVSSFFRYEPEFGNYTGNWLINFDWGDNGLRAPFLGQVQIETVSQPVLKAA